MTIIIGSDNPVKIQAVHTVFPNKNVIAKNVSSDVSTQPFSDEETLLGAKNRAKHAVTFDHAEMGIGLEGGVMRQNNQLFLCNWGVLIDQTGKIYVAGGARIPLPVEIVNELNNGQELGIVMEKYTNEKDVRKKGGAMGVFTNQLITRSEMFIQIVTLLKGQYEFDAK